jgi:hypothetical protein
VEDEAELVTYRLLPDNRALGPRFGSLFPKVRAALAEADPQAAVAILRAGQKLALDVDGQLVELAAGDILITPQPRSGFAVKAEGEYVVALDTAVTPALRAEGLAREFVRRVQDLRKSAGFDIADRIITHFIASPALAEAVLAHADYVQGETLSVALKVGGGPARGAEPGAAPGAGGAATADDAFDGEKLSLRLEKARRVGTQGQRSRAKAEAKTQGSRVRGQGARPKTAAKSKAKPTAKKRPAAGARGQGPRTKAQSARAKPKARPAAKPKAKAPARRKPRSSR